jgi:hypothetical protein
MQSEAVPVVDRLLAAPALLNPNPSLLLANQRLGLPPLDPLQEELMAEILHLALGRLDS